MIEFWDLVTLEINKDRKNVNKETADRQSLYGYLLLYLIHPAKNTYLPLEQNLGILRLVLGIPKNIDAMDNGMKTFCHHSVI